MDKLFTGLLFAGVLVGYLDCCSLPSYIMGDWESSDVGLLNFNDTAFGPYTVGAYGDFYFECYLQVGTKYIVKSTTTENILSTDQNFYLCIDLRYLSNNKYRYYLHTASESAASNQRVKILPAASSPTELQVCDDPRPESTYFMLLKNATAAAEKITCPSWFLVTFNYTSSSISSFGSVCIDNTEVYYNTSIAPAPMLGSTEGLLSCMYHYSSGSTNYLTLYNLDSAPSSQFFCMVSTISGSTITYTFRADACGSAQTPLTGGGPSLQFDILSTCPIPTVTPAPIIKKNSAPGTSVTLWMVMYLVLPAMALILLS